MRVLTYLSHLMIPFLLFWVLGCGLLSGRDIYGDFLEGAKEGLKISVGLIPTLVGLFTAVGILRASGFLDFLGEKIGKITETAGICADLIPLALVRLFSSSAAVGLLTDIFKKYGTDSPTGFTAGIMMCATESIFYCMSIYFGAVRISKTRYTLAGALLANFAGIAAAIFLGGFYSNS